jgi:curved DNA-binding protein CbpA
MGQKQNLYEVLEVTHNASSETIESAYRTLIAARRGTGSDTSGQRIALEEAYRTLSHPESRKRYDAKRTGVPIAPIQPIVSSSDDRPWLARNRGLLILIALFAIGGYGYHKHTQSERAAIAKALQAKEELLAKQQTAQEDEARRRAETEQQRAKRIEDHRYQQWLDQSRREGAAHARQLEQQRVRSEHEAARQERMEQYAKQREEAEARARLEQEKRKLQRLEAENYGQRRY